MGQTAENVASQYGISRDAQDEFALTSQNKTEAAQKSRHFIKAISPFTVKSHKGDIIIELDRYIRHGATIESMQKCSQLFWVMVGP